MAEEMQILREFRNEYVLTNAVGQVLVDLCYRVSLPTTEFIAEHPNLKSTVRIGPVPVVAMNTAVVNISPTVKTLMAGVLILVSIVVAICAARPQKRGSKYI